MAVREGAVQNLEQRLAVSSRFQSLLKTAIRLSERNPGRLLQVARLAGRLAWSAHPGFFVLPEVECALRDSSGLDGTSPGFADPRRVSGRTLHVLTKAHEVGGHTRLVSRWIQAADEDAAVVLVRQREAFAPTWVAPESKAVPVLDFEAMGIKDDLPKVSTLRILFQEAARVVLHIHPDDATSVAAAHRAPGADIRFFNHADHVAWLGAALPAMLLNARPSGARLAVRRRGVPESSSERIVLPLEVPRQLTRRDARARLGIGEDQKMLLTVASGYKYNPVLGRSLLGALTAVLRRPDVKLVAIGPDLAHPVFGLLAERFPGRVEALGVVSDPDQFRAAADVYVDSYPLCSPTSLLESALMGAPAVAFQPDFETLEILYSECPGVDRRDFAAEDSTGFSNLVSEFLDSASRRESVLHAFRLGVEPHLPEQWRAHWAAILLRRPRSREWTVPKDAKTQDLLDIMLAGLGKNPCDVLKQTLWTAADLQARLRRLATQFRDLV